MPSERMTKLLQKQRGIASNAICASCGGGTWDFVETTLVLQSIDPKGGFEVFPLVCNNCGHMNLYSVQHLEGDLNVKGSVKPPE